MMQSILKTTGNSSMSYSNYSPPTASAAPSVFTPLPFSKRKFSSVTLSTQPIAQPMRLMPYTEYKTDSAIPYYTRNLRHATQASDVPSTNTGKGAWGKPTWYLLHMMAEKMQMDFFNARRTEILQTIFTICTNLPCPTCSGHAKEYLSKTYFFQIRTLDELKMSLFLFHNNVNMRTNAPVFPVEQLTQYMSVDPPKVVQEFLLNYNRKSKNIRLLPDDMHRQQIAKQLHEWFSRNMMYFNGPTSRVG